MFRVRADSIPCYNNRKFCPNRGYLERNRRFNKLAGLWNRWNNDRTDWDLPSSSSQVVGSTYEYNLNVTKLAQTSLELGRNKFDFALTSVGGELLFQGR